MLCLSITSCSWGSNNSLETQTADLPGSFLHSITRPMLCYCKCYRAPWPSVPPACQPSSPAQWVLTCSSVHFKWTRKAVWGELTHYYNRPTAGLDLNMCIIFELLTSLRCSLNTSLHTQGSLGAPNAWLVSSSEKNLESKFFIPEWSKTRGG